MIDFSATTLVVVFANSLTAVLSATLLMMVFWQNPYQRLNQVFAAAMLALAGLSITNTIGRFIHELGLDADTTFYIVNTCYAIFVLCLLAFAILIASEQPSTIWTSNSLFFALGAIGLVLMWAGYADNGIEATAEGNYRTEYTALGYIISLSLFVALLGITYLLYQNRHKTPHAQYLWAAPVLILVGVLWALFIWPEVQFPATALTLAAAAFILGRAVLLEKIFDPVARYSAELQARNQELAETNQIKSQFLTNISNELRAPLNNIIGYTDLIMSGTYGAITPQQGDRLEKVIRNARHLHGLINDILDLSRIEGGGMTLTPQEVNTAELLEAVIVSVNPQLEAKKLAVMRDFSQAPPLFGDKMRVQQIFTNILSNAIKFTHEGHIRVQAYGQGASVRFEITDTGIGIPAEKHAIVFEEFRQANNTVTREYGGTGLGMPITKYLVEMSGGTIWFSSEPGVGTTFYVTLPQAGANIEPVETLASASSSEKTGHESNVKVLIIDDSLDSQILLRDVIRSERPDYQIFVANSGQDGLRRAHEIHPDLITLDVMMPSMDGWEVLKVLKTDAELASVPVILVSIIDNHHLAYQMGASAVVEKPVDIAVFIDTIERLLKANN